MAWLRRFPILRGIFWPGERALSVPTYHRRRRMLTFAICLAFALASLRLAAFARDDAQAMWATWQGGETTGHHRPSLALTTEKRSRANILDANGSVLASNIDIKVLCHRPGTVRDPAAAAQALKTIIPEANVATLAQRLSGNRAWLTHEVSPRQQQQIHDLYIEGIEFCDDQRRVYPYNDLFAHALGFTDVSNQGLTGMESRLDLQIQSSTTPIQTSLDATVQAIVAEELEKQIARFEAVGGVAILMRANTAEVVSLISLPTFDPSNVRDVNHPALFNRATKGVYELGSVMKPFTIAAAMNEGLVTVDTQVDVTKNIKIEEFEIEDFPGTPQGIFTVAQVIEHSSNIGTARIADLLGPKRQQAYLNRFGFTRPVEIELAEIASPLVPTTWGRIQTMTIGFGHGISVTPLQLVAAEAALVNGGLYREPTLLNTQGRIREGTRVIDDQVSALVRSMLRRVAVFGSGKNANAAGYVVGGKTGTAEKFSTGGYNEDARIASFLGAFPIHDPEYVLLVSIDEPKPQDWTYGYATGGWVAAPAFARIVDRIGPHLGIQKLATDPYGYEQPTLALIANTASTPAAVTEALATPTAPTTTGASANTGASAGTADTADTEAATAAHAARPTATSTDTSIVTPAAIQTQATTAATASPLSDPAQPSPPAQARVEPHTPQSDLIESLISGDDIIF